MSDEKAYIDADLHAFYDVLPTVTLHNQEDFARAQAGASVSASLIANRPPLDDRRAVHLQLLHWL